MKVIEAITKAKSTLFSIEILPPIKGKGIQDIYDKIDPLMELKPSFVDVTYHREEYIYKKRKGGGLDRVAIRKRPGTVSICAALMTRYKVAVVPHLICGGFTVQETEDALVEMHYLGINNVLVIRGDAIKSEHKFVPEQGGNPYAIDVLKQTKNMNKGIYLEEEIVDGYKTDFCVGVAGYAEKHFEAPNMEVDLHYLKQKVDAGADYIVTQMFFDNQKYFDFVKKCRDLGIKIPIIPGLKPLTTKKQIDNLPSIFHIDIPPDLYNAVSKCKDNKEAKQAGIEWGIHQSKELKKFGVPCLHYYTMGKGDATLAIVTQVF